MTILVSCQNNAVIPGLCVWPWGNRNTRKNQRFSMEQIPSACFNSRYRMMSRGAVYKDIKED